MREKGKLKLTRRQFLKVMGVAGASLYLPWGFNLGRAIAEPIPGGTLDPTMVDKYVMPLIIPPAMPKTDTFGKGKAKHNYYEIAVRQFQQQILPTGMPKTTVWSYGSVNHPGTVAEGGTFNYPAFTIEAKFNRPVRVKWINNLVDANNNYLPHLLPVDPTLHWANPPGGITGRDMRPEFEETPGPYTGPVPMVPHLHGGHNAQESDGYAEAWYLPLASNIPSGFAAEGTWYDNFKTLFEDKFGVEWDPGTATFQYENDQRASTLWYHDHTLGMTRLNVYAGPAGFYLIRRGPGDLGKGVLPGPAPGVGDEPFGTYYEIPIVVQDRSFNTDGSLFYPDTREFFDEIAGPYIPDTDVPPIWNPEFFGNTMVVNGRTWPFLNVEPRRYRFRILNGCNSRFLILKLSDPNLTFWQIGADGGFLPAPVALKELLLGPAERADVIVDFSQATSTEITLLNVGPDEPFKGFNPDGTLSDGEGGVLPPADPDTTGQAMKFNIVPLASRQMGINPAHLTLPAFKPVGLATITRKVSLNEEMSMSEGIDGPVAALLGTVDEAGNSVPLMWDDPITENPALNSTEIWEIHNFTADAHPIHVHEVMFQVVNREGLVLDSETGEPVQPIQLTGVVRPPESWESGLKDTVIAYPGEVTRIRVTFDLPGLYVWHCHILEHEDNEMMRPYFIGKVPPGSTP